ncbi:phage holin family protein [Yersinia enterocolitica]|uniref:phage holin family protein n=1 Tax=Yersinia enterocolitica TaxID=630 RepID=UPI0005E3EBD7|nr:phage holin family protein [Yersinia enterocolitica]CNF82468.1 putative exported phage-related protein [Yersinia enterocolitica]
MSEPITSTGAATATVTGVTFIGLLSGLDAGVVVGAFAGAAVLVLSASDFSLFKKLFLFGLSWGTGVLSAPFITSYINFLTPDEVKAAEPVGAMVAGAVVIRLLMWANKESKNPGNIIDRFRSGGGKPDE